LGFVFTRNDGSATIGVVMFVTKGLGFSVYDYQGNRVRSVVEFNNQAQSQRDYLPLLDISTNETKQQS
jgi:hypothetical protein